VINIDLIKLDATIVYCSRTPSYLRHLVDGRVLEYPHRQIANYVSRWVRCVRYRLSCVRVFIRLVSQRVWLTERERERESCGRLQAGMAEEAWPKVHEYSNIGYGGRLAMASECVRMVAFSFMQDVAEVGRDLVNSWTVCIHVYTVNIW